MAGGGSPTFGPSAVSGAPSGAAAASSCSGAASCSDALTASAKEVIGCGVPDGTSLWPALLPTPKLDSLLSKESLVARTRSTRSQEGGSLRLNENSTERVDRALGVAFDRLWRDRPAVAAIPEDAEEGDPALLCTVDGYISRYFHRVASLSRESVYQAHQRKILNRMREDVVCGDRCGKLRDLDDKIKRAELDDQSLQAEMTTLMRIVEKQLEQTASPLESCCGGGANTAPRRSSPCCAPSSCCQVRSSAPATKASVLSSQASDVPDNCSQCTVQ